jgi:hypothetical protein
MDTPRVCAIEYSVATDGCDFPFSIWDRKDGETPSCRASSRSVFPDFCRAVRNWSPRLTAVVSAALSEVLTPAPFLRRS